MTKIVFHLLRTLAVLVAFAVFAAAAGMTWGSTAAQDDLVASAALDADADGDGDGDLDVDLDLDADIDATLDSHVLTALPSRANATGVLVGRPCGLRPAGGHAPPSDRPPRA